MAGQYSLAGDLDFVKENIFITIHLPDTMSIRGEYYFASHGGSAVHAAVVYPFPVDSTMNFPHAIRVFDKTGVLKYQSHPEQAMVLIPVSINEKDTNKMTVVYRQRLLKNTGRYILMTTQSWGKPLGRSNYCITVPSGMTLSYLSYECDTLFRKNDSLVYRFIRTGFMPTKDIIFSFKRK